MTTSPSTNPKSRNHTAGSNQAKARRGVAFLLLVMVLLIVVMTFTQAFVRVEVLSRRTERSQWTLKQLQAAIDSTSQLLVNDRLTTVLLPVNETTAERIEVTREGKAITARWIQGDTEGQSLTRTTQ